MGLNWKTVRREHVAAACDLLKVRRSGARIKQKGLLVRYGDEVFPAKDVAKLAYCLANGLPHDAPLKFASGDGTLRLLRDLGFEAERLVRAE